MPLAGSGGKASSQPEKRTQQEGKNPAQLFQQPAKHPHKQTAAGIVIDQPSDGNSKNDKIAQASVGFQQQKIKEQDAKENKV